MALKYLDMKGKTEEEAISKALKELGLERDDVSVEILERAKSGFFGIGASPAKVRVTYGLEEEAPKAPQQPRVKVEQPRQEPVQAPAKPEKAEKPERAEKRAPRAEKPPRPQRKPKAEPRQEEAAEEEIVIPAPAAEDLGEPCNDEKAQQIRTFLTGLLQHMDCQADIAVYQPEKGRYKVILEGEKMGALIGRRGETLDAIQQLTSYSVNRGCDKRVRIQVDAENYRLKREQNLQQLARKVAAKAIKYRRNVTLEPMNAYERHVIHTALQDVPGVTTYSMGTEPNRRVIVAYQREQQ